MLDKLWVIHDPINWAALCKCGSLEEAREQAQTLEPTRIAKNTPGWDELEPLIYRYEVKDKKAVNPVKEVYGTGI